MALEEFAGAVILEVDGKEVECVDIQVTASTGTKPVKTMNRKRRVKGFARGIATYDLRVTVVIPLSGDLDWENLEGAKISIYPVAGGKRTSYVDVYTSEVGETYNVDNEARRDLQMFAGDKVVE